MRQETSIRVVGVAAASLLHLAMGWAVWRLAMAEPPLHAQVGSGGPQAIQVRLVSAVAGVRVATEPRMHAGQQKDDARPRRKGAGPTPAPKLAQGSAGGSPPASARTAAAIPDTSDRARDLPDSEVLAYRALLEQHLAHYWIYPVAAQNAGDQGVVVLHFVTNRSGRILDAWIETSSGVTDIDRGVLRAIGKAQPLPPFPDDWPEKVDFSLPVTFKLG